MQTTNPERRIKDADELVACAAAIEDHARETFRRALAHHRELLARRDAEGR